jgi:HK97 gp10 family phage protein
MARIEVKGLRELGESLKALRTDMAIKIAKSATGAAASEIKKIAKSKAHVADKAYIVRSKKDDPGILVQPGNVPKNIIIKQIPSKLTSEHIVAVRGKAKYGHANRIGIFMEFGTVRQAALPFMRPAFDTGKSKAIDAMVKKIKTGIAKATK